MDRIKTFGKYIIWIVLFYIFSNVMINIAIKSMYVSIDSEIIERENVKLEVDEARATYVNGYVSGNIKNTGNDVINTYVKIDLYSKRNVLLGTKYVEINNLLHDETKDFRMGFKFTDVDHCVIKTVDELEENVTQEELTSTELKFSAIIAAVILLCYLG